MEVSTDDGACQQVRGSASNVGMLPDISGRFVEVCDSVGKIHKQMFSTRVLGELMPDGLLKKKKKKKSNEVEPNEYKDRKYRHGVARFLEKQGRREGN